MLAYWAANLLPAMMSRGRTPIAVDLAPNARTLTFALFVTILTILLFGLLPAAAASRQDVQQRSEQPIRRRSREESLGAGDGGHAGGAARASPHTGRPVRADLAETAVD